MTAVRLNPHLELVLARRGRELSSIAVVAPVRGRSLSIASVAPAEREIFAVLADLAAGRAVDAEIEEASWARLVELGVLVAEREIARPVRFRCAPAELPLRLFPRPAADDPLPRPARLRVNPTLRFDDAIGAPGEGRSRYPRFLAGQTTTTLRGRRAMNPLAADCAWARIEHAGFPMASAISVREEERAVFRALEPGEPPPAVLPRSLRRALARAGVLVDPAEERARSRSLDEARAKAAEAFRKQGFAVVRGLVHPAQIAALRRYYRELIAEGWVPFGERFWTHDEPMARFLLGRLTSFLAGVTGQRVKPAYAFLASYTGGASLAPHKDRAQCAFSVSLLLDYRPEPAGASPWPLRFDLGRGRRAAAELGLGDGVVYRGDRLTHHRDALPAGHVSTSVFLHYVSTDFRGSLE
jgi:hypothetical protein